MSSTSDSLIGAAVGLAVLGVVVHVTKKTLGKDIFNFKVKGGTK